MKSQQIDTKKHKFCFELFDQLLKNTKQYLIQNSKQRIALSFFRAAEHVKANINCYIFLYN